jgi:FkbM family methyltransferase
MCPEHIKGVTEYYEREKRVVIDAGIFKFEDYRMGLHTSFNSFTDDVEIQVQKRLWVLPKDAVVIDVGAAFGTYTLPALYQGAQVYAFEPNRLLFDTLSKNIALNNWTDRCQLFNYGLAEAEKTVKYNELTNLSTLDADASPTEIKMRPLDTVVNELNPSKITIIKIDVEGTELDFLAGARQTIIKYKPALLIEVHTADDADMQEKIVDFLSTLGIRCEAKELNTGRQFLHIKFINDVKTAGVYFARQT